MKKQMLLGAAVLMASSMYGQQKDVVKDNNLDQVIVTANKVAQKQSQTGKVISVITKEQIEKSAGKTVAQLLNEQAGITINGALNNAGSVQTVFMRGASSGRTLILIDGIPANDPSDINNNFDLNLFSINDVERIEVCKGAQSTLYGSDAVAGVINIITVKKDVKTPFNVKATLSAGNKNTANENLQLFGKADKLTYTARFGKIKTDGFSAAYDSTGKKNFDNDGYDGTIANAHVQYQATEHFALKAFTQYSQYTAGIDAGPFADKRNDNLFSKDWISGAGFNYKNDVVTLVGNYQYSKANRSYDDNASIPGATAYSLNNYNSVAQYAELYTSIKLGSGFSLLGGGDYRFSSMNNQYTSLSSFGPYNGSFPDTSMRQVSAYASIIYNNKHLNIELGGRYNNHSRYGTNYTYSFNPSYNFDEHYKAFGSIATGFKAPSLYQLFAPFGTGNPNLKAEKSTNYEIGLQQQYKNFSNRLVFFYRNINNGIDYDYIQYTYFNFVNQVARGIEYEIKLQPTKNLDVTANYTFVSLQQATQNRANTKDTTYNYALRVPKHNINVTAGYQFTKALYVSVSGKYVSSRYDVGGYHAADVLMNSYFLLGAHAGYKLNENVQFFVTAQNMTNQQFFDVRGYNSIPFMYNGGVTFQF